MVRPVGWTISAYLVAREAARPSAHVARALESGVPALGCIATLAASGHFGPAAPSASPSRAAALASLEVVTCYDKIDAPVSCALRAPLLACVPMVLAVLGALGVEASRDRDPRRRSLD